jgi:hypothetical protein
MKYGLSGAAVLGGFLAAAALVTPALAGPTYSFDISEGTQPSNAGKITLTQDGANSVIVDAELAAGYGFLNTGGPHTPFAFNLSGSGTLTIAFTEPTGGTYPFGTFSLNTSGGDNTPYGSFGIAIDNSAGNGSGKAYYGELKFTLTRTGSLSTDDFVMNSNGAYFSADLTNGSDTGAQAWKGRTTTKAPEPLTLSLFGAGLAGMVSIRRRKKKPA